MEGGREDHCRWVIHPPPHQELLPAKARHSLHGGQWNALVDGAQAFEEKFVSLTSDVVGCITIEVQRWAWSGVGGQVKGECGHGISVC